jgi:membrane protease YdiL (CAAX protease family)
MPPASDEPTFALPPDPHGPGSMTDREPRPGILGPLIAWAVILAMVVLLVGARGGGGGPVTAPDGVVEIPSDDPVASAMMTMQGRVALGFFLRLSGAGAADAEAGGTLYDQTAAAISAGPPRIRLRMAVLAAELAGPERGLRVLDELDEAVAAVDAVRDGGFALSPDDAALAADLRSHLASLSAGDGGTLEPADEARFAEALGWWGRLAAVLPGTDTATDREATLSAATRAALVFQGGIVAAVVAGIIGLVLLIVAVVRVATDAWRPAPITPVSSRGHGRLAETFALWIVLFFALQLVGASLVPLLGGGIAGRLAAASIAFGLSLSALFWPRIRGLSAADLSAVSGLNRGRGVLREVGAGVVGYLATLPLLGIGLFGTILLAAAAGLIGAEVSAGGEVDPVTALLPATGPAHPIVGEIGRSLGVTLLLLLTGAVAAPVVEEVFFRGCLHTHLRHVFGGLGGPVAVILASFTSAFLFAVIHPQGWIAVPALMSLAIGFSLAREWRGGLIAPITMHAINNGVVLGMLSLVMM